MSLFVEDTTPDPRTWSLPAEPGPEVTAVRDTTGRRWRRGLFWHDDSGEKYPLKPMYWPELLRSRGPLTDASDEVPRG